MKALACCSLLLLATAAAGLRTASSNPTVMTPYGSVMGIEDVGAYAFKGVPYAAPPVGNLRFAAPEDVTPWTGTRNATVFSPGCMAECPPLGFPKPKLVCTPTVSEDCLYLNIYTPTLNSSANLPVMIFIHGGNYVSGSGGVPMFDASNFARNQSVVVVTINYRLGAFGGLFTGTVRGNFQTMDQRQSMKWVKKSISAFGGNPNRVIISGQSAGATSMAVHLTSPKSWPYFHGAIIESYPASLIPGTPELVMKLGVKFLDALGCPQGGEPELECLRNADAKTLLNISMATQYTPWPNQIIAEMMRWQPVVDGDELPYQPLTAMQNGNVSKVPIFLGTNANETSPFIYGLFPKPIDTFKMDLTVEALFGLDAGTKALEFYGKPPASQKNDVRPFMTNLATDYIFYCPARQYVGAANQFTDSYMYFFDKAPYWNKWFYSAQPYCQELVCHASDIPFWVYPWGTESVMNSGDEDKIPPPHEDDIKLANFVQTAWANFVKSSNPNLPVPLPNANGHTYQPFNKMTDIIINSSTPVGEIKGYRENYCEFWDKVGYLRN